MNIVFESAKLTTVLISGFKNKRGSPIDPHPGYLIQLSAKHQSMVKKAVVVTKPAVIWSAWYGSLFIIFFDMNYAGRRAVGRKRAINETVDHHLRLGEHGLRRPSWNLLCQYQIPQLELMIGRHRVLCEKYHQPRRR